MELNLEEIKTISELSKPFIEPLINSLIKPHIKRLDSWLKRKNIETEVVNNFWEDKFSFYLENLYRDSSFLTTLVFPNSLTKIQDLYVPLTLVQANSYNRFKIDKFDYTIFNKYNKILISDYAGMGKSTLLKWITLSIIEKNDSIPILIELRKIDDKNSIIDEIFNQINPLNNSFNKDFIYELLDLGFFTILLDGFDEIPYDQQENITVQLRTFIKKTSKNNFILTSRPESALSTFTDFQMFYIYPLEVKEAYSLIEKLDFLSKVKFGEKLITEIKEKNSQVIEFLTNPFLVSLLYKSYTYNKDIPSKKITFYDEVYSCLYKHHDLSKEGFKRPKRSRLDIFDFELILREIGFTTSKIGKVIYSKDEMIQYISQAKLKNAKLDFKELNFFEDLTTTVPIFAQEGFKIKWAHKSIQDFFAAKYISNHSKKEDIIKIIYESEKFHYLNILDLLYELEYNIFRKIIIKDLLSDFISYYESQYKIKPTNINQKFIDDRIGLMFGALFCIVKVRTEIGFDEAREIFVKKINEDDNFGVSSTFHQSDSLYYTMNEISLKKQLVRILKNKKEDIFIENVNYDTKFNWDFTSKLSYDKAYVIDDDLNNPCNSEENFHEVSYAMRSRLADRKEKKTLSYNLDYQKCKKLLLEIITDIQVEESEDLFKDI